LCFTKLGTTIPVAGVIYAFYQILIFIDAFADVTLVLAMLRKQNTQAIFFIVWASSFNPFLGCTRYRGRCVEQPFDCLIIQNRQTVQTVESGEFDVQYWALEDNMVDSLFFCSTLTSCRRGHTLFVQVGAETSDTGAEAVEPDPCTLFLAGPFYEGKCSCRWWKYGVS